MTDKPQVAAGAPHQWPTDVIGGPCTYCGLSPAEFAQAKTTCYRLDSRDQEPVEPAPAPLPEDHISRFWIPGAWLVHEDYTGVIMVTDDECGLEAFLDDEPSANGVNKNDVPSETGWRFHVHSPIQTPKEP